MLDGGITEMQTRFIRSAFIRAIEIPIVFGKDNQLMVNGMPAIIQEALSTLQMRQLEKINHDANYFDVTILRVEHSFTLIPSSLMIEFDPDGLVLQLTSEVAIKPQVKFL
jgi:hypothetical protein